MFTHTFKCHLAAFLITALATVVFTACATTIAQPSTPAVEVAPVAAPVEIVAQDHFFEVPAEVEAGWVTFRFTNAGQEPHHAQLARLNDGVTLEQFGAALQNGPIAAMSLISLTGGPGPLDPNGEQTVTLELQPGNYLLLDFLAGPDGVPHVAKGMITPFTVVAGDATAAQAPTADAELKLVDFSFALPSAIRAGEQIWKITADSTQPHEISLIKLAEGQSAEDVLHWMHAPTGQPPFANVGGMQAINPGTAAYLHLNLTPGNYVAICHVPDPASGKAHSELGMILPFTVE
jgi:hypothetical protein